MQQTNLQQGTPKWLDFRKTKIMASDSCAIMQVSPWKSPLMLFREKLGLDPEPESNPWMKRGLALEPEARAWFEREYNMTIEPCVMTNMHKPWMGASYDGIGVDEYGKRFVLEIKVPGREDHATAALGLVPEKYLPQLMHLMVVAGVEYAYYLSYNIESQYVVKVERDYDYINKLIELEKEFWDRLQNFDPPPKIQLDYDLEKKEQAKEEIQTIETDEWKEKTKLYLEAKMQAKYYKDMEDQYKDDLIALCGRSSSRGAGIRLSKTIAKGQVDYKQLVDKVGIPKDQIEACRKPDTERWTITEEKP